ncbi:MAG: hypothetical protein J6Y36_00300 [Treponema sp.]|nr:hypothetical protein [Treponema sp.]
MKKYLHRTAAKILSSLSLILAGIIFSSCQDPIFYHINQEVKLEDASIFGDVFFIARHKYNNEERLYFSNGIIYYKNADDDGYGKWKKSTKPAGRVVSVVSDSSNLYALVFSETRDDYEGEMKITGKRIYRSSDGGSTWELHSELNDLMTTLKAKSSVSLMCTNAINPNNRYAYANIKGKVYNLGNNSSAGTGSAGTEVTVSTVSSISRSCVYAGGVKFFNCYGACTDESKTQSASKIFASENGSVYIYNTSGTKIGSSNPSVGIIYGIASFDNGNQFMVTSSSGSALMQRQGNDDYSWSDTDYANLTSTLSSLYEGMYALAVDPSMPALSSTAYAGLNVYGTGSNSALFSHEGLWAYYPARAKWNIE